MNWQSFITIPLTAVISGYIGVRLKAFVDRARPTVIVAGCRFGEGRDLLTTTVELPPALRRKVKESPWIPTLEGAVNAAKVARIVARLRDSVGEARSVLGFLEEKLNELPKIARSGEAEKRTFLCEISEPAVGIIDRTMTAALVRQEVTLAVPENAKAKQIANYVAREDDEGGYAINLRSKWYNFFYRDGRDNQYLLPAVEAMAYFHQPSLQLLLEYARDQILRWAAAGDQLVSELEGEVRRAQRLVIDVSVTNRGHTPLVLSPWARLDLRLSDRGSSRSPTAIKLVKATPLWKPDDPIIAAQQERLIQELDIPLLQEPGGLTVNGLESVRIQYQSIDAAEALERDVSYLRDVLAMEMFSCTVYLYRLDRPTWVASSETTFEKNALRFPDE